VKSLKRGQLLAISTGVWLSFAAPCCISTINSQNSFNSCCFALPHVPETSETPGSMETPVKTSSEAEANRLDKAIQPYVAKARAGLPALKKRFTAGLPKEEVLMLTIRVYDPDHKYEQVFVTVQKWTDKEVTGSIASELIGVKTHKMGDVITFDPKEILDWTVIKSDGTEEGNVVGNFLNDFK
jgi:Uncharacterized protein conserved in bacteria (DUF2314)